MAAQLVHADVEGQARAGGGPLEHERHALSLERAGCEPVALQLQRAFHELDQLVRS